MILEGKDHWEVGSCEGSVSDLEKDVLEEHISAHCFSVCDDRFSLVLSRPIPTIQLNTPASAEQNLSVDLRRRLSSVLPAGEVRVV